MKLNPINQNTQREHNLSTVVEAIHRIPSCTRVRLAEVTGLTQAAITKLINQLIEWGAVSEQETVGSGVGRKATVLQLNSEKYCVLAIRINRDYINTAVYDIEGRLYGMERCGISAEEGPEVSMERLIATAKSLIASVGVPVWAIGVAVPGPFKYREGRISLMSGFPGWDRICIREALESAFALPVFVDQDSNCGALAELWFSGESQPSSMLFITADRGIGAGLIMNSRIYRGRTGFAGEFGHTSIDIHGARCECGNRGCLELYSSSVALENAYRNELFDPSSPSTLSGKVNAADIMAKVRAGDPTACRVYARTVSYLCFGVAGMIHALDPSIVVFADKLTNGGSLFLETAMATFKQYLMPEFYERLQVKLCSLDGDPMLLGAGVLAYDHILRKPTAFFNR